MNTFRIILLATATLIAGCSGQPDESVEAGEQPVTDAQDETNPAEKPATVPAAYPGGIAGTVTETLNSGGYTYVNVDTGTEKVWAAVPQVAVSVGDSVKLQQGMPMQDYTSKTLGRTFDVVYFCGGLATAANVGMPAGHGTTPAVAKTNVEVTGLARVEGGQTVAEVFAGQETLVGSQITLRAKVVKFSGGILGTNFMHVQDGTGGEGTNDLTITSKTVVAVGDTVVVSGVLVAGKDFGFGYKYDLIVEDAEVTVE